MIAITANRIVSWGRAMIAPCVTERQPVLSREVLNLSNRSRLPFRHSGIFVTPVKTGVHAYSLNLDTVFATGDDGDLSVGQAGCLPECIVDLWDR